MDYGTNLAEIMWKRPWDMVHHYQLRDVSTFWGTLITLLGFFFMALWFFILNTAVDFLKYHVYNAGKD